MGYSKVLMVCLLVLISASVAWGCIDSQDCDQGFKCVKGDCVQRQPQNDYQRGYDDGVRNGQDDERSHKNYQDDEDIRKSYYDKKSHRWITCSHGFCN